MTHKNYKSDFDAILHLYRCRKDDNGEEVSEEIDFPPYDWVARFYTSSKANAYIVSCIGGQCTNCFNDGGKIHVVFDSHRMGPGVLNVEFVAQLPNSIYPDGLQQEVRPQPLDIELVSGMGDCGCCIDMSVVLPYAVVDAYDMAVAAGFAGTAEEYYAGLSLLPALSAATSDFAAGKGEVAAALRLQGIDASEADSLHDMARDIAAMRLAADSEPGVISHNGCGVPDLLNLLHNNRRLDDYPYSWAVRTADNHVILSGADAYLCSDGYFTTEPGEHTFANTDEVPESWVIFYHSSPNYTVTASAGILSEICVYNGAPDYNVTNTPDSYLRGPLRSYSPDRRVGDGSVVMNINAPRATEIYLPQVTHLVNPGFTGENNTTALSLPDLEEIQTSVYIFASNFLRIHMPSLRRIVTNTYCSYGSAIKSLILPALETFSGGTLISNSGALTSVSLPSLREVTSGGLIRQCNSLAALELPALETLNGSICFFEMRALASLSLPVLKTANGTVAERTAALTELNLPALETMQGGTLVYSCAALTELTLPALETMQDGTLANSCAALTELNLPALETMQGGTLANSCAALTELNLPALETIDGWILTLVDGASEAKEYRIDAPQLKFMAPADDRSIIIRGGGGNILHVNIPQCTRFYFSAFNSRGSTAHLHFGSAIESIYVRGREQAANASYLRIYISEGARPTLTVFQMLCDADNLKQFIADLGDNNNYNTKSLQIGAAALALLSEDDIALAVAKNYTLS